MLRHGSRRCVPCTRVSVQSCLEVSMTLLRLPTLCRMSTTALLRKGGSSCYCTGVSPGLSVIVSHPEFIAINKPPGLPFHSRDDAQGVIPTIRRLEASGALPQQGPLYPLHRLDEVTSGIMLLGRNADAAKQISTAFEASKVRKCYIALSDRKPRKKAGTIKGDMAKARRGDWKLLRTMSNPAITKFVSYGVQNSRPGLRLYILTPVTGQTHQIRVALKSLGSPILGDVRYADATTARKEERTYLHAASINFQLNDEPIRVLCPPDVGSEFMSEAFKSLWTRYLPLIERGFD